MEEENNNNLGDFFRKRLSSKKGGDEDWFNPDLRIDDLIIQKLVTSSKEKKNKNKWLLFLLPCFLFLGMLGYILHLKDQILQLNNTTTNLLTQNISRPIISSAQNEHAIAISTTNNKKTTIKKLNSKNKNQQWNNLKVKNQQLQKLIRQKDKTIQTLQIELSQNCKQTKFLDEIEKNTTIAKSNHLFPITRMQSILEHEKPIVLGTKKIFQQENRDKTSLLTTSIELEDIQTFKNLSLIKPTLLTVSSELLTATPDYTFSLKKKKSRKQNSFEIGMHVGIQRLSTQEIIDIPNQRIIARKGLIAQELMTPSIGLNIGYSPIKNLWIRTGVQFGGTKNYIGQEIGIVYNDFGEYLLSSGDKMNDLTLNRTTGYSESVNTLQLTIPNGTTNGDLLELDHFEELHIRHLQIPLSVEYFFGAKKWQPFIFVGTKWNLFHYEYKTSEISIESENQAISFGFNTDDVNDKTLQYMSLMTGGGLNLNLRSKLSLRATAGFEGNFLLNETKSALTDYSREGFFVNFGFYYKF